MNKKRAVLIWILGIAMEWESQRCLSNFRPGCTGVPGLPGRAAGNRKEKEEAAMVARWLPSGKHTKNIKKLLKMVIYNGFTLDPGWASLLEGFCFWTLGCPELFIKYPEHPRTIYKLPPELFINYWEAHPGITSSHLWWRIGIFHLLS